MSPPSCPRSGSRRRLIASCAVLLFTASGCAGWRGEAETDPTGEARAARIEALERSIAADRAALAEMVTTPRDVDREPLHEDGALRTLAERLRAETAELERLRHAEPIGAEP